ncbi:uncharacterized protein LOC132274079 isoform X5 [Cornus florida]|uniref:uncharacterized protein LOC132274079 isoform X5 n=1 Tax=Cornus florida TaxID=4283 RepID=UPI0028981B65|nr:uncharacterized protein LOC132274079 isoform X5 [Cornus florida]
MVKAVIGEETQLKLAEDRLSQSAVPSQVGLVIGKLSSSLDRGFVFDLIPTPPNDAGEPACSILESVRDDKRKGTKAKSAAESSSLVIDKDWVVEHARQVSRMLLGGMKVVGIYIWVNESTFKNSTPILCQAVKGVAEAAPLLQTDGDERLLIHISYSPRRWTCRNCTLASNITSSNLHPCDFKMGRVLNSLQKFSCTYNFDMRLPICSENASNIRRLVDILRHGISSHAKELKGAKALIDGKLVLEDEQLLDGLHEVEFLLPFMQDASMEACSQKEVLGVLILSGSVCSFAYLNSKEPFSQALADIKGDIIMSLQSRLAVICDEADGESDTIVDGGEEASNEISAGKPIPQLDLQLLRENCSLSFPRRVFVPWLAGTYICDYLQPSETLEVLKDHCVELMAMEATTDASTILEPEIVARTLSAESFWDLAVPFSSTSSRDCSTSKKSITDTSKGSERKSMKSPDFNIMAAIVTLILSI